MEEVPKHEQLFMLMDVNARTGRREKGGVESEDNKIIGDYGRDTLNDNGELLLSFAKNHDLATVNKFFSPAYHILIRSTGEVKNVPTTS